MSNWGEVPVARRTPDDTHQAGLPRALKVADGRYAIPRYDLATATGVKTVGLRHRNDALFRIGGTWAGSMNTNRLQIGDGFRPSSGNDLAMVVCDSRTGFWVQVWGYGTYLWETLRLYPAGSGKRWIAAANELRAPKLVSGEWRMAGDLVDFRTWTGNARGMMGASLGPQARGATRAEVAYALAQDGILPRVQPCYVPNTGGAICPAGQVEGAPDPKGPPPCPGGQQWAYPSTEEERQDWASDRKFATQLLRRTALVWARSLSTDGRGAIAAASSPASMGAYVFAEEDLGLPPDLLEGMPGLDRPIGYAPMVGYRMRQRVGTDAGLYDDIEAT